MKRAVTGGSAEPGSDAFLQRFQEAQRTAKRRVTFRSIPKVILSEEVPVPLPISTSLLPSEADNDYVPLVASYCDAILTASAEADRAAMRTAYVHQAITHVVKTQALVASGNDSRPRDQGFTQPTVLILLPYKRFAVEVVDTLIRLHCKGRVKRVYKKSRRKFEQEYTNAEDLKYGDDFKLGLTLAPRHHMFLYTPFKHSDIILASPLALSALLTEDSTAASSLASIEVLVIDEAGIMHMQNWDHVEHIWDNVNQMPSRDFVTADIERVREYWLDQRGSEYRQNIVVSEILTPQMNALLSRSSNRLGSLRVVPSYSGVLAEAKIHRFRRFECTPEAINEQRFQYFTQDFWPKVKEEMPTLGVVFCSSYFEFVRLKSWFETEEPGVVAVSEYTSKPERQRAVAYVEAEKSKAILLTERLVYFRHTHIRGAKSLVFYSLPLHAQVYTELATHMGGEEVWCVFSHYDALHLQRLLGDEKAKKLVESKGTHFAITAA